jgi:outer membrane receptor protein involved in Fe transport
MAAFGTVTGHLAPGLDLQVGGRYAHNKQDNLSTVATTGVAQYIFGFPAAEEHRTSESPFTWLVSPSWHITPDVMVYARVANGYRPGGTNTLADGVPGIYRSDRVVNYEAGAKGSVLGGKLDFDLSVFQIDWTRIQLQNTSVNELTFTTNGAKARSRGVELAGTVRPWTGGAISGNATFTDAVLTQALPSSTNDTVVLVGAKGDRLPNSARFTANIGLDQKVPLGDGINGSLGVNYAWTGQRPGDFLNTNAGTAARAPDAAQLWPARRAGRRDAGRRVERQHLRPQPDRRARRALRDQPQRHHRALWPLHPPARSACSLPVPSERPIPRKHSGRNGPLPSFHGRQRICRFRPLALPSRAPAATERRLYLARRGRATCRA